MTGENDLGTLDQASSVVDFVPGGSAAKRAVKGIGTAGSLAVKGLGNLIGLGGKHADEVAQAATSAARHADATPPNLDAINRQLQADVIQPGGGCFAADTPVSTPDGLKPIGEFQPGDVVLAFDHERGTWQPRRVEKVHRNFYEDSLVTIHTETDAIRATVYHPMWVLAGRDLDDRPACQELSPNEDEGLSLPGRWVNSHNLRPGDVLIDTSGNKQYVMRVEQEFVSGFAIVNLTVEGDHTFAVGTAGLLVHNTCAKPVAVPNPNGKRGGPDHQAGVDRIVDDILSRGLRPQREFYVPTPDGRKSGRFLDAVGIDPKTGEVAELHQVGKRTKKSGIPVKRERDAIEDIQEALGRDDIQFLPYN